jgi:two-component system, chemotaxis family, protein-glutamate methylesterase/glutaminase
MSPKKIRVVIADDSLFMRGAVKKLLDSDARFEVVGVARDGVEAVERVLEHKPDVVSMDFNMPRMNGIQAVRKIMETQPTAVVMLSAHTREGARETIDALAAGAVDFLTKPNGEVSADLTAVGPILLEKLLAAAGARLGAAMGSTPPSSGRARSVPPPSTWPPTGAKVLVVGISTGGPSALSRVLPALPGGVGYGLLVVQHMPAQFTATLAERLDSMSEIEVREARDGDRPRPGLALVAPGDRHVEVGDGGVLRLTEAPEVNGCRPSADVTMKSAARVFGRRAIGLIMTGMGRDGAEGLLAIKQAGGLTLAQSRDSCVIWGMPRAAMEIGAVSEEVPLDDLAARLARL